MANYQIRKDPHKNLLELTLENEAGERWEYGIPFNHRGEFDFDDIHPISLEFGDEFAEDLMAALENAVEEALQDSR